MTRCLDQLSARSPFRRLVASLAATLLALALATSARAADTVYPRGLRIGLTPLQGLAAASNFVGFESADSGVKVLLAELPAKAFVELEAAFKAAPEGAGGVTPKLIETPAGRAYYTVERAKDGPDNVRRYSMIVGSADFSGYVAVQVAEASNRPYSDDDVRKMFGTVSIRAEVPPDEHLSLMPFRVEELGGFKTVRTLAPGAAVLLADGTEQTGIEGLPFMVLGMIGAAPDNPDDRGRFAQQTAMQVPGLRDGRITMSEPLRINGAAGFETRIDGVTGKDSTPVTMVQWLRFGSGGAAVRVIASAPRGEQWPAAFTRFRAVRDGIKPK